MASLDVDSPTTWVPYMNNQDCSQKICNLYCPQWCNYVVLPSPPPPPLQFSDDDAGGAALSPLVIVIIGVFGSVCLLISYYVIISRLCIINNDSSDSLTRIQETPDLEMADHDDYNMEEENPLNLGPWHDHGKGLDEGMINSIRVCKYKKEDSLITVTDCPVCLGEFQENENLRVLPKCNHAFHVYCIDTWLTSHSNCPLCRANVSCVNGNAISYILPPPPPPTPPPPPPPPPPSPPPIIERDAIIEIREDEMGMEECQFGNDAGSSIQVLRPEQWRSEHDDGMLNRVLSENNIYFNCGEVSRDMMKRSFSSGRYFFIKGKTLTVSSVPT